MHRRVGWFYITDRGCLAQKVASLNDADGAANRSFGDLALQRLAPLSPVVLSRRLLSDLRCLARGFRTAGLLALGDF